jgi:hypothetical protein
MADSRALFSGPPPRGESGGWSHAQQFVNVGPTACRARVHAEQLVVDERAHRLPAAPHVWCAKCQVQVQQAARQVHPMAIHTLVRVSEAQPSVVVCHAQDGTRVGTTALSPNGRRRRKHARGTAPASHPRASLSPAPDLRPLLLTFGR